MSVFNAVWGIVDVVNNSPLLKITFPTHEEQEEIALGFSTMSGADFDKVILALDGILIWIQKPSKREARANGGCGDKTFLCGRKCKFGVNMQALCDHLLRFRWVDINWPGATADYMAWVTSDLYAKIKSTKDNGESSVIKKGYTIVGDNAYVKSTYMAIPFKGTRTHAQDAYNFYQSQLRINIERAFGMLVHRWGILRGPLVFPLAKVAPFVNCLCILHNYCIDQSVALHGHEIISRMMEKDAWYISDIVHANNEVDEPIIGSESSIVTVSTDGSVADLIGAGEHFRDCPPRVPYNGNDTPMDEMVQIVRFKGLMRPLVNDE